MINRLLTLHLACVGLAFALCSPCRAEAGAEPDPHSAPTALAEPDYLALSLGYVGVLRHPVGLAGGIDYRWHQNLWNIHPAVLVGWTSSSRYANVSLVYIHLFENQWFFTLSSGPGSYGRNHNGEDLGLPLEFLSSIEVGRQFSRGQRLALGFSHISNASLASTNPGNELVRLTYSLPLNHRDTP